MGNNFFSRSDCYTRNAKRRSESTVLYLFLPKRYSWLCKRPCVQVHKKCYGGLWDLETATNINVILLEKCISPFNT